MNIPFSLKILSDKFFLDHGHKYDMAHADECGEYMEAFVVHAKTIGYSDVKHLKKNPGQTQYNGHAIDAFLYTVPELPSGLFRACDIINSAEAKPPYGPHNPAPSAGWSPDIPRYTMADIWIPGSVPTPKTVPWVAYDENGFQRLKKMLAHDYARRPQGADFDVSIWAGRYFHNCYMGPDGIPLGEQKALEKIKPELCSALSISNDGYYGT